MPKRESGYKQGRYVLKNPHKYIGNQSNIVFRSSWEHDVNKFLDNNPRVLRWSSEEIAIKYISPVDGRVHHYYPDYWVEYINQKDEVVKEVIEVKPEDQARPPKPGKKKTKTRLFEERRWQVNQAKWHYAELWCKQRGFTFRVLTEKDIFGKSKTKSKRKK